jgi:hypothetical protein
MTDLDSLTTEQKIEKMDLLKKEVMDAKTTFDTKASAYKMLCKQVLGFADGDTTDVLTLAKMVIGLKK